VFIDYVSLLLVNMVAGYFLLAAFVYLGLDDPDRRRWAPGFLMVGLVATVFGGLITLSWPLPGPYNAAFGEMSVLFGVIFLGAGLAMAIGWSLATVAGYAFFAGSAAIVIGARIISLKLTLKPALSGTGFIVSGFAGVMAAPTLALMKNNRPLRAIACLILIAAGLIWAVTVYPEYWMHLRMFGKWTPLLMRSAGH